MRLALTDLYHAKWTQEIHKEWMRNLLKNRPNLTIERLESVRARMDLHVRDGLIEGYEELIDGIKLSDPNDRHVLAAAIKANAQTIVTYNLSDFPLSCLSKYEIDAQHPDEFLRHLLDLAPAKVIAAVQETRKSLKSPPKGMQSY
jgi:predicted nucleic acid-binding protein